MIGWVNIRGLLFHNMCDAVGEYMCAGGSAGILIHLNESNIVKGISPTLLWRDAQHPKKRNSRIAIMSARIVVMTRMNTSADIVFSNQSAGN